MIITDLDGTLLNDNSEVSIANLETLRKLGEKKIIRVAATGRSLHLVKQVLSDSFPIDYVIFSSGAGIFCWREKKILNSYHLSAEQVENISELIKTMNNNLMIFNEIPENHHFKYWVSNNAESDFVRRLNNFKLVSQELDSEYKYGKASQILTILPPNLELFKKISETIYQKVSEVKVIRASSPIDGKSIWIEIFPKGVSKGDAVIWLCNMLKINISETLSIGNDYNDLDMLNITQYAFVVSNSPQELLENPKFKVVSTNNLDGFSNAVEIIYGKN